tara:strand:+ start:78 stop:311 length:234 start_codon:yes stop_codon:yes gene_type:complete
MKMVVLFVCRVEKRNVCPKMIITSVKDVGNLCVHVALPIIDKLLMGIFVKNVIKNFRGARLCQNLKLFVSFVMTERL